MEFKYKLYMKFFSRTVLLIIILSLFTSFTFKRIDYRDGMNKNVCKELRNNVLVYFVFVDTKTTSPWTEFDIRSTIDSLERSIIWIETKARERGVPLNIISDYYIGTEYTTLKKDLPYGTVSESASSPSLKKGLGAMNKWADVLAKKVGGDVEITVKDGIPEIKNPKNKERLVAHLRDAKQVESVALLYMINNYYQDDVSLAVNHLGTDDVEFAVVSYKYPAVIAQNILTLFGAANLYDSFYRRNSKKIALAESYFPKDIMQEIRGQSIDNFSIGEYTEYLIGWSTKLDPKYHPLLSDKLANY